MLLNWYSIAFINTGACMAIPIFYVASTLLHDVGLFGSMMVTFIAGIIWIFLGITSSYFATKYRKNTYELIDLFFGRRGVIFFGLLSVILLVGWTALNTNILVDLLSQYFNTTHNIGLKFVLTITLSLLAGYFAIKGIPQLLFFSIISVPILVLVLFFVNYTAINNFTSNDLTLLNPQRNPISSLSYIVGSVSIGFIMSANLACYAKNIMHSILGILLSALGAAFALIMVTILIFYSGDQNPLAIFIKYKAGWFFAPFIILGTWGTNDFNLYSASLALNKIFEKVSRHTLAAILTIIATSFSLINFFNYFMYWLSSIAILIPPVTGTFLGLFIFNELHKSDRNTIIRISFISYFCGAVTSLLAASKQFGGLEILTLTHINTIDGILVSLISSLAMGKICLKRTEA